MQTLAIDGGTPVTTKKWVRSLIGIEERGARCPEGSPQDLDPGVRVGPPLFLAPTAPSAVAADESLDGLTDGVAARVESQVKVQVRERGAEVEGRVPDVRDLGIEKPGTRRIAGPACAACVRSCAEMRPPEPTL